MCIAIVGLICINSNCAAQTETVFTPNTEFNIVPYNSTIRFAVNGTYTQANLENNSWVFSDLQLVNSPLVKSLRASTCNCNVTILSFAGIITDANSGAVHYNVSGPGVQTFNFGLKPAFGLNPDSHYVVVRLDLTQYPDYHQEGDGWTFSEDGTITITNATSQAYIFYRDYSDEILDETLPFYQTHLVTVFALSLVAAISLIGIVLKLKKNLGGQDPELGII